YGPGGIARAEVDKEFHAYSCYADSGPDNSQAGPRPRHYRPQPGHNVSSISQHGPIEGKTCSGPDTGGVRRPDLWNALVIRVGMLHRRRKDKIPYTPF